MSGKAYGAWLTAGFDMWMLGAEAASVMALRTARIAAGGPAGAAEAELMVTEKIRAAIELQTRLMTGAFGHTPLSGTQGALKHYRRKVAANSKRLTRRPRASVERSRTVSFGVSAHPSLPSQHVQRLQAHTARSAWLPRKPAAVRPPCDGVSRHATKAYGPGGAIPLALCPLPSVSDR